MRGRELRLDDFGRLGIDGLMPSIQTVNMKTLAQKLKD